MWGKTKNKRVDFDRHLGRTTMIAVGTEIHGDIIFDGGLLIEGVVHGNVRAKPDSEALLRIAEGGEVYGEISAPNVVINGRVCGDVYSSEHVELAAKAIVNGNVNYSLIEMVMGAEVNGALVHLRDPVPLSEKPVREKALAAPEKLHLAPAYSDAAPAKERPVAENRSLDASF